MSTSSTEGCAAHAGAPWVVTGTTLDSSQTSIMPMSGPASGGTQVAIRSPALFPAENITCTFGTAVVLGNIQVSGSIQPGSSKQLLQLLVLSCETPQFEPADVDATVTLTSGTYTSTFSAPFAFYEERRIVELEQQGSLEVQPPWIDFSGKDNITIRAEGAFSFMDHPRLRLVRQQEEHVVSRVLAKTSRLLRATPGNPSGPLTEAALQADLGTGVIVLYQSVCTFAGGVREVSRHE
jgi:hypothetical protein